MKIICTKREKAVLTQLFTQGLWCPTSDCRLEITDFEDDTVSCKSCIEESIEWEVTDENK